MSSNDLKDLHINGQKRWRFEGRSTYTSWLERIRARLRFDLRDEPVRPALQMLVGEAEAETQHVERAS